MQLKILGKIVIGLSAIGLALTILIDYIGLGKPGVQAAQLLGMLVFVLILFFGIGFLGLEEKEKINRASLINITQKIMNRPAFIWVGIGFLVVYGLLYIPPMFFHPILRFKYFINYLPLKYPIGLDFRSVLESLKIWLIDGNQPTVFYPPLFNLLFAPFLLLEYPANFVVLTSLSLTSYLVLFFVLPLLVLRKNEQPLIFLILVTTLVSYGVQFELERGQFHSIAFMLCMLGVYIFHYHRSFRYLAYLLFILSIQIKIYPVIFIFLFVQDWRDWKGNLKRFFALGIVNFLLLFVLGIPFFNDFLNHLVAVVGPTELKIENHSITSFVMQVGISGFGIFTPQTFVRENASVFISILSVYYFICFLLALGMAFIRNRPGIDKGVLLVSVLGSLLVPTINHDYTLPLLSFPFMVMMTGEHAVGNAGRNILRIILILISTMAYSVLLFPYKYRPDLLINSMPSLMILLTAATILNLLDFPQRQEKSSAERVAMQPAGR